MGFGVYGLGFGDVFGLCRGSWDEGASRPFLWSGRLHLRTVARGPGHPDLDPCCVSVVGLVLRYAAVPGAGGPITQLGDPGCLLKPGELR